MKKIFFIFLIFVPTILFAQATRRVTDRATNETYHVLRSDRNIRHGEYQKFDSKRTLLVSGQYKLGERDGFWMHFALPLARTSTSVPTPNFAYILAFSCTLFIFFFQLFSLLCLIGTDVDVRASGCMSRRCK